MAKKKLVIKPIVDEKQLLRKKQDHQSFTLKDNNFFFTGFTHNTNNNGKHSGNHHHLSISVDENETQMKQAKTRNIFNKAGKRKTKHAPILSPTAKRASVKLMSSISWAPNYIPSPTITDGRAASVSDMDDLRYPAEHIPPSPGMAIQRRSSKYRISYKKAIQKAGYNMNELVGAAGEGVSPVTARKEAHVFSAVDWTDNAFPDHHIWTSTSASGDLCYVGEDNCQKTGPRKRCSACHIVVHELCLNEFAKIGFPCKTTFREFTSKAMRESLIVHHHWVHRRKLEGKCKQCGKPFEKRFGFREPTKIIAISCSWCKEAYHNKVHCFQLQKINEPCSLGALSKSIVPSTWIIKSQKQKSIRNRSKRRSRSSSGTSKKRSTKENRTKPFVVRPLSQQAAFICPTLVFINPKSGGRQGAKLLQSFQWLLNPRQVFDLSKEGPREPLELYRKVPNLRILACGGDGTVGWILSILDKLNLANPPPVAILPLGTGNDLSRTLNFGHGYTDEPIQKVIQGVEEARQVKLDRWKLTVEKNTDAVKTCDEEEFHPPLDLVSQAAGVDQLPLDVINNYFGIGSDAQVTLSFHESREAHPAKFTSRFGNKFYYARAGVFEYLTRQSKDLSKHITVECDGVDLTPKIRELKPVSLVFLNIPRFSSGTIPWGNPAGSEFRAQRHDDKFIEVVAFSLNQLGMIFVGGHGERLTQCQSAIIRTTKAFPVHIDGEPCKLNPSIIHLDFLNQANMLTKSKRGNEIQSLHEQIKIRVNVIQKENFDAFKGVKEPLSHNATPLLVTVVMNQSTLETVRSCLLLIMSEVDKTSHPISEKWMFLDSSKIDRFISITRSQESHLVVSDVMTSDRQIYILDVLQHPKVTSTLSTSTLDQQTSSFRNRVRSDSGVFKSSSTCVFDNVSQVDGMDEEIIKFNGVDEFDDGKSQGSVSTLLDVVFEQSENGKEPVPNEGLSEKKLMVGEQTDKVPMSLTRASPALSHLRQNENRSDSDCSSTYSTSSNEYVLTDESGHSPTKHRKSPLRIAYSNPPSLDFILPEELAKMSVDDLQLIDAKQRKMCSTDYDATKAAGFNLSPSQLLNSMRRNRNQSNNNGKTNGKHSNSATEESGESEEKRSLLIKLERSKENEEKLPDETIEEKDDTTGNILLWNKTFLDATKRGDLDKMQRSFTNGAQLIARDDEGCTALHHAVRHGYDHILDWLLKTGDVEFLNLLCRERKQTALHKAAWYGRTKMCEKLLSAGASLNVEDYKGMKAVDRAKQAEVQGLVELFLKCEASREHRAEETHL